MIWFEAYSWNALREKFTNVFVLFSAFLRIYEEKSKRWPTFWVSLLVKNNLAG